ncbi:MAG TPA: cobyrinate a,c-diamide synthase [Acidimicrobiales bacterium]|nr:cobyrinate a,c-diamide synthase [Acidimicrobiales bacterium]
MPTLGPRVVIAGTHSGVGKTTIATGLMAAFRARGGQVGAAKVGPDFIDPGYHSLASGRPSRNLDPWMCGMDAIAPLAGRAAEGCDLLVIEGVMGLFDGAADGSPSSTAAVADTLDAPVVLVVDAASASTSVAATIHGFNTFDPRIELAGVILNRVGSDSHESMLRAAVLPLGIPVLGVLRRDPDLVWRDRHLGLIPVIERPREVAGSLRRLAARIEDGCDLEAIMAIAQRSPGTSTPPPPRPEPVGNPRIAVAAGPAFSFCYPDNLEALGAAGAELVLFDPCVDRRLPDGCTGLVAGGGFPEVYAEALSQNVGLLGDVHRRIADGLAVWAECGGLLWLCRRLDDRKLAGVIDTEAVMTERLTLGYRQAVARTATPIGPAGTEVRGHEYHYSRVETPGSALAMTGREGPSQAGFASPRLLASYLHVHLGARPDLAEHFVRTCGREAGSTGGGHALRLPYMS